MRGGGEGPMRWVTVPYLANRGILHQGDYPHAATPVRDITPPTMRRVILGLNCFPPAVGPCCARAPEHSAAFVRTIRLYQAMAAAGIPVAGTGEVGAMGTHIGDDASILHGEPRADGDEEGVRSGGLQGVEDPLTPSKLPPPPPPGPDKKKRLTLEDVKGNPVLRRMLIAAANKMKAAQTPKEAQEKGAQVAKQCQGEQGEKEV